MKTTKIDRQPVLSWKLFWVLLGLSVLSLAGHLALYPALPDQVPRQWALDGSVNSWWGKQQCLWLWLSPLALLVLFKVLPAVDPRSDSYRKIRRLWNGFTGCFMVLYLAFTWMTELYFWGPQAVWQFVPMLVVLAIGGGMIALGNYMPRIRQNYTMGAKTPWALASEHCWQRPQRMCGIVFVVDGAGMILAVLADALLGTSLWAPAAVALLLGGLAWVYLYSWLVYTGKMK